jgi:hypothetical protein
MLPLSRLEPLAPVAGADHLIALGDLIPKRTVRRLEERRTPQTCASARLFAVGAPLLADPAPLAFSPFP